MSGIHVVSAMVEKILRNEDKEKNEGKEKDGIRLNAGGMIVDLDNVDWRASGRDLLA